MRSPHDGLPLQSSPEVELHGLDGRVVWYWRLVVLIQTVGLWLAMLFLDRWLNRWVPDGWLPHAVVGVGLALAVLWPPARYRSWGFQLRERDLYLRRGVLSRTTSIIPHSRIQHVDTRRDPLEQWLGLARVIVFTAGIRGAQITIPGVAAAEAASLRDRLAELGGLNEGV